MWWFNNMKTQLRQLATKLRVEKELSYSAIKKQLGVSKSTLSYWLKDLPLSENKIKELQKAGWQKSEASRERYRNTMEAKETAKEEKEYQKYLKKFQKLSEDSIFIAGLMLYLAEGDKKVRSRIVLANTDPMIIQFFVKWLVTFLDVDKNNIKVQLHLYEDIDLEKEKDFWHNELEISKNQFYKSSVRKIKPGSFTYKDSIRHGTCSIYVLSVEKKRQVSMAIKAFLDCC